MVLYFSWLCRSSAIVAESNLLNTAFQRARFVYSGWRNQDLLFSAIRQDEDTPFRRRLRARPTMLDAVIHPYQSTNWNARTRLTKLRDHYDAMVKLRWLFDPHEQRETMICDLSAIDPSLRLVLDEAIWFKNEGPLVLNLFLGEDRIYSIAFALRREAGDLIAHVGAVQGRNPKDIPEIMDTYRDLTRQAHGMRPRDLLIELFRTLCIQLGVTRILLVSDQYQHHRAPYFGNSRAEVRVSYDEVWIERGAVRIDDTMFELPVYATVRARDQIPARKRALYRRRYDMLNQLSEAIERSLRRHWQEENPSTSQATGDETGVVELT